MMKPFTSARLRFLVLTVVIALLFLAALFPHAIMPNDPYAQDLSRALQSPGGAFPLGTDRYGRCLLSRILIGAGPTIFSTLAIVLVISIIGTLVGMICGYTGKKLDTIFMRIADTFLAFPGIVFAIAAAAVLGGGLSGAITALIFISWPKYARAARSETLRVVNSTYMQAAKLGGYSRTKIIFIHILPNIAGPLIITAFMDIGVMMMELASLSFLGLGAAPPAAEWGAMLNDGRSMLQTAPRVILAPGFAIFFTIILFNLLGDTIRDLLDPRNLLY